jgi:hypothetical protein
MFCSFFEQNSSYVTFTFLGSGHPAAIPTAFIARLNREYTAASAKEAIGAAL